MSRITTPLFWATKLSGWWRLEWDEVAYASGQPVGLQAHVIDVVDRSFIFFGDWRLKHAHAATRVALHYYVEDPANPGPIHAIYGGSIGSTPITWTGVRKYDFYSFNDVVDIHVSGSEVLPAAGVYFEFVYTDSAGATVACTRMTTCIGPSSSGNDVLDAATQLLKGGARNLWSHVDDLLLALAERLGVGKERLLQIGIMAAAVFLVLKFIKR